MNGKKILFFDTETTGLPPRNGNPLTMFSQWPHICQLSWTFEGTENDYIIKPEGWEIPPETTAVHGITQQDALANGYPFQYAVDKFVMDIQKADLIVAHNIRFDVHFIVANYIREYGADDFQKNVQPYILKERQVDTMMATIGFVQARYSDGRPGKWPRLEELYDKLFPGETYPAHNAIEDVRALERCFRECVKREIIKI